LADTLYTRTLIRAAEAQGSTQSLASLLRVPENTLLRWMSGRAQMPLQAFLKLIEVLAQHEKKGADTTIEESKDGIPIRVRLGALLARCARCDGTEFAATEDHGRVRFTSEIACRACGEGVIYGNLVAQLAKDAVAHSRTLTAQRTRSAATLKSSRISEKKSLNEAPD
jgi:hypothetical protein